MMSGTPSALQEIGPHPGTAMGIRLFLKREDLLDPELGGNKFRKLQPALECLRASERYRGIVSFGGPYSNHLYALAAAGRRYGFPTVGIVRGLTVDLDNATLGCTRRYGMALHPVSKRDYDLGQDGAAIRDILAGYPDYIVLPEGGTSAEAVAACRPIGLEIVRETGSSAAGPLIVAVAAGTGGTAAGVAMGLQGAGEMLVFAASASGVRAETVARHFPEGILPEQVHLRGDFDFGGFARWTPELLAFVRRFRRDYGVQLDMIYTGKMLFGLFALLEQGYFEAGSRIVAIHTGGLQGLAGFRERFGTDPAGDDV